MTAIELPSHGLSLANLTADARHVDWTEANDDSGERGFTALLPAPTAGDWADYSDCPKDIADRPRAEPLSEEEAEAFQQSDAYGEWEDGFYPMMNYAWPVDLAYGTDPQRAAELIALYAPSCTLLSLSDDLRYSLYGYGNDTPEYAIALTGGGMDLSDHIATAYLCCGCVPPERLLSGLSRSMRSDVAAALGDVLRQAFAAAADHFRHVAQRIDEEAERVFPAAADPEALK